jgi:uncharacterized protein YjbI with pentapeptide repeats
VSQNPVSSIFLSVLIVHVLVLTGSAIPVSKRSQVDPVTGRKPIKPLSRWSIYVFLAAGVGVTVGTFEFLLTGVSVATLPAADQAQLWMEAVKTALTAGIGAGGLLALYVSFRRQMVSERDHLLQSHVARNNQLDASEKRVTELYSKAVDQLANNTAAVRLAGLYALERLAQANPEHRQTIVDVICGYLRISREVPKPDLPADPDSASNADASSAPSREEAEVRATAQKILKAHLILNDALRKDARFWNIHLDLHGARLEDFSLRECQLGDMDFRNVEFVGEADFASARFEGEICFDGAIFRDSAIFGAATFDKYAHFRKIEFCGEADFEHAKFKHSGDFRESNFRENFVAIGIDVESDLHFDNSEFFGVAWIRFARFSNTAQFDHCVFHDFVQMIETKAGYKIRMNWCTFHAYIDLGEDAEFELVWSKISKKADAVHLCAPPGWYVKEDVPGDFAVFRSPEMDEMDRHMKEERDEKGFLKPKAAENGSDKDQGEAGHTGNGEVTQSVADAATHAGEDESATSGQFS